jgi:hypothetical protein
MFTERIRGVTSRKTEEINYKKYQLASIGFTSFMEDSNFRLVVMREKNSITLFLIGSYIIRDKNTHEVFRLFGFWFKNQAGF